jgi:hypothetical protein
MKKASFTCLATLLVVSISSSSFAQLTSSSSKFRKSASIDQVVASEKLNEKDPKGDFINNVNSKALRHFTEAYPNSSEVRWVKLATGFRVHFTSEGIDTRIYYNEKGTPEATVRYYYEKNMSPAIRHQVKTRYYDFEIFLITEITAGDKTAYLIKMEDKTCWKTVRVADNEMEVAEEYSKR